MRVGVRSVAVALALGLVAATASAGPPAMGVAGDAPAGRASDDTCRFFRSQAVAKALTDYTREMLWACEEISRRRAAQVPLGDRLEATGDRLEAYRIAIMSASNAAFHREVVAGPIRSFGLSDEEKLSIADATGVLLALEAIRTGF